MSSSSSEAPECSRARDREQPESSTARDQPESSSRARESERRPWVALSSIPVVIGADDERASALAQGVVDFRLHLELPLGASYLVLPQRLAPGRRELGVPYVLAACASHLLVMAPRVDRDHDRIAYFLADAHARAAARIGDVPFHLRFDLGYNLVARRSIGHIADPRSPGGFLVAQLHPTSTTQHHSLLCYATATGQWYLKPLASAPFHPRWDANGVLAHDGRLWWIDTAYGMLVCDPFQDGYPHLHFVPLPPDCQMPDTDDLDGRAVNLDENRFIRCSQGEIRYVQIRESAYDLFTLVNPDGPDHWRRDYTVDFTDVWAHPSYGAAGLPLNSVPNVALVDPNNAEHVYFFLERALFAVDGVAKSVLHCQKYVVESIHGDLRFQNSRYIDAWELPPTLLGDDDTSSDGRQPPAAPTRQAEAQSARGVAPSMPSSSSEAAECSSARASEQPESPSDERHPWVALSSIPVVIGADHPQASTLAPGVADLRLDLEDPLRASYVVVPERIVPAGRDMVVPYILAACSSQLLFMAPRVDRDHDRVAYFLADAHARTVTPIPDVSFHLRFDLGYNLVPRRSIGLIADPRHPGTYLVAQLHPPSATRHDSLLCYATGTDRWKLRPLASAPFHPRWHDYGVLAHDGKLWWVDTAYGMLVCDPFKAGYPRLRFVPLPRDCRMPQMDHRDGAAVLMDEHRCIRVSQGMLRYVQIRVRAYDMYTLINPDGPDHWREEYTVNFADIWRHPTYRAARLTPGVVPSLALVDPNDAHVVYFFLGTSLFAVDGPAKWVLAVRECVVDSIHRDLNFQSSRYIDAWMLPPSLRTSSDGGSRRDVEELSSLLSQMEIRSQPDMEPAFSDLPITIEIESGSSANSSDQADAEAGDQAGAEDVDQAAAEAVDQDAA